MVWTVRACVVFPNMILPVWCWQGLYFTWKGPMETLDKAGKAFLGLEALLGGSGFQVEGNIWRRQVCVHICVRAGRQDGLAHR